MRRRIRQALSDARQPRRAAKMSLNDWQIFGAPAPKFCLSLCPTSVNVAILCDARNHGQTTTLWVTYIINDASPGLAVSRLRRDARFLLAKSLRRRASHLPKSRLFRLNARPFSDA